MTETRSLLLVFKHSIFVMLGLVLTLSAHATTEDTQTKTRSNPVIAKPEAFKVQRQSGGLAYQYEIELPEAAGIAPRLKLSFNSLNGNGEVGRGWALNSSHIERSTRKGLPTYAAPASGLDTFELEGSLLVPDPGDANRFHLQQNDHRRILYRPGSDSWEVTDTDGTRYLYGSRSEAQSTIRNYGRQPELPLGTFRWSLDTVIDPRGNWYEIDYESETYSHRQASGGTIKYTMNNHLHQIRYSFHSSESSNRKRRIVDFQWGMRGEGEHNDDRPTSYRSGFKIQISQRLTDIIVGTDSDGDNQIDARIARYELRYDPKPSWNPSWDGTPGEPGDPMLPIFSRLSEIQRYGATDADVFPGSMKFNYKRPDHTVSSNGEFGRGWQEDYQTHSSWSGFIGRGRKPPSGLDILSGPDFQPWGSTYPNYESQIEFLDMDNDGLVDRVYVDEEGRWTSQKLHARTESAGPGFQADQAWYWHCGDGGSLSETCPGWSSNIKYRHPYSSNSDTFDINGDGLPDHVVASNAGSGYEWHVFKNLGRSCGGTGDTWYAGCFAPVEIWAAPGPIHDVEYTVNMAKPNPLRGTLVDVNGDGLPDYVSGHNGGEWFEDTHGSNHLAWVSINTGSGFMEPEVYSAVFSRDSASEDRGNYFGTTYTNGVMNNQSGFTVSQIFADANGDGLADRFSYDYCMGQPSMSFSMGDGWQTEEGIGQKHWDFPEDCTTGESTSNRSSMIARLDYQQPKFSPEAGSRQGTHTAMLDFNGDGINDIYHYGHFAQTAGSTNDFAPAVWYGLGDGTYLTLKAESNYGQGLGVAPGIPWRFPAEVYSSGKDLAYEGYIRAREGGPTTVDMLDFNGDGLLDRIMSNWCGQIPAKGEGDCSTRSGPGSNWALWTHPGPNWLLTSVTHELGGVTEIEYEAHPGLLNDPFDAGYEDLKPNPEPQFLVSKLTQHDGRSGEKQERTFGYSNVLYDIENREYAGAEALFEVENDSLSTSYLFHPTADLRPRMLNKRVTRADGWNYDYDFQISEVNIDWIAPPAMNESGQEIPNSWFPQARVKEKWVYDEQKGVASRSSQEFDPLTGNLIKRVDWGPNGELDDDSTWCGDASTTESDDFVEYFRYIENFYDWLIEYPQTECERLGSTPGQSKMFFYDNLIGSPSRGLLTSMHSSIGPDQPSVETQWVYDDFGNMLEKKTFSGDGELASHSETQYDSEYEAFPRTQWAHPGYGQDSYATQYAFNTDHGEVSKVLSPNGHLGCWEFDTFGRLTAIKESPDSVPSAALDTAQCTDTISDFEYFHMGTDPTQQHFTQTQYPGDGFSTITSRSYFDGLGRIYQEENEQRSGEFSTVVRSWDPFGALQCESLPFNTSGGTPLQCDPAALGDVPVLETRYNLFRRPSERLRVTASGTTLLQSYAYSVQDLDGLAGDEFVTTTTVHSAPSPDRITERARDTRGNVVAIRHGGQDSTLTLLRRDAKGRIILVDGPDITPPASAAAGSRPGRGRGRGRRRAPAAVPDPNQLAIHYDHRGLRTQLSGFWGDESWLYSHDASGRLAEETSPGGKTIQYHYDQIGRLLVKDYAPFDDALDPGAEDIVYFYDTAEGGLGKIATVDNPYALGVDTSYTYNFRGQVDTLTRDFGEDGTYSFGYTYDRTGRTVGVRLPNQNYVFSDYNSAVISEISATTMLGGSAPTLPVVNDIDLHPNGSIAQIGYPLVGGRSTYGYDPETYLMTRMDSEVLGETLQAHRFEYDRAGNPLHISDELPQEELSQTFTYDDRHRLLSADSTGLHAYPKQVYGYNDAGNLTRKGSRQLYYGSTQGGPHAVSRIINSGRTEVNYSYDTDGAMTVRDLVGGQRTVHVRDQDGRVAGVSGLYSTNYVYDETGERVRKYSSNGTQTLYVDPKYEVDLSDPSAPSHRVHFFHGTQRVATEERSGAGTASDPGATTGWLTHLPDSVGSNSTVIRDTGETQKSFFRPYGEFTQSGENLSPYLFTDQEHDAETGLHYYGARYYDPLAGRFMSHDPALIGPQAGVTFKRIDDDPAQFNPYTYALNSPRKYIDPNGEAAFLPLILAPIWTTVKAVAVSSLAVKATTSVAVAVGTESLLSAQQGRDFSGRNVALGSLGGMAFGGGIGTLAKAAFSLRASSNLIGGAFSGGASNAATRGLGGESLLDPVQTPISLTAGLAGAYVASHVAKGAAQAGWNRWATGFMEELIPCFLSCSGAAAAEAGAEAIEKKNPVKPDDSNQTEITKELNRSRNRIWSGKIIHCRAGSCSR